MPKISVSPFSLVKEGGDVLRSLLDEVVVDQELDALLRVHVELFLAHLEVADFGSATHDPQRVFKNNALVVDLFFSV